MSLFLGDIHFWLFNKIRIEDGLTRKLLIDLGDIQLEEDIDKKFGKLPKGDLKDIVDEKNIHGSLQGLIDLVDARLAYVLTYVLEGGIDLNKLIKSSFNFGQGLKEQMEIGKNKDLSYYYELLNDIFLSGMPCSRANEILEIDSEKLEFRTNREVYEKYFTGELEKIYKDLKCSLANGILKEENIGLVNLEEDFYLLRRL